MNILMGKLRSQMSKIFLDTAYVIALLNKNDNHHDKAREFEAILRNSGTTLITTTAILLEIGNALSKLKYRRASIIFLKALTSDPAIKVIPISESLYDKGFSRYSTMTDKEWGLVDCISFIVMEQQGITEALTADKHFKQAGFNALLIESE